MSKRERSRSPHIPNRRTPSPKQSRQALWRQRRQTAESQDYEQRQLSPARLSPYRSLSPNRPDVKRNPTSWADECDVEDEYQERMERAYSGLEKYKSQFKRYTSDANKENVLFKRDSIDTASKRSVSPTSVPKTVEIVEDLDLLIRRQKDIDYGKNQEIYADYLQNVDKPSRSDNQPWTPDKYEKMTRRNWDKQIKIWRKQLHYWENPKPIQELLTPGTSPCPSPHRRRSPPRSQDESHLGPKLQKALFQNFVKTEDAMDSFENQMTPLGLNNGFSGSLLKPTNSLSSKATVNILSENAVNQMKVEMVEENSNSQMSVDGGDLPVMFRK